MESRNIFNSLTSRHQNSPDLQNLPCSWLYLFPVCFIIIWLLISDYMLFFSFFLLYNYFWFSPSTCFRRTQEIYDSFHSFVWYWWQHNICVDSFWCNVRYPGRCVRSGNFLFSVMHVGPLVKHIVTKLILLLLVHVQILEIFCSYDDWSFIDIDWKNYIASTTSMIMCKNIVHINLLILCSFLFFPLPDAAYLQKFQHALKFQWM